MVDTLLNEKNRVNTNKKSLANVILVDMSGKQQSIHYLMDTAVLYAPALYQNTSLI